MTDELAKLRSSLAYWQTGAINWEARVLEAEKTITTLQERLDAAEAKLVEIDRRLVRALATRATAEIALAASETARERLSEPFKFATDDDWRHLHSILVLATRHSQDQQTFFWRTATESLRAALASPPAQPLASDGDAQIASQTPLDGDLGKRLNRDDLDTLGEWATRVAAASRQATLQELRQRFRDEHLNGFLDLLDDEAEPAPAPSRDAVLEELLLTAKLLLQNSIGCAVNHYDIDVESNGLPGWLDDAQKTIQATDRALKQGGQG